MGKLCDRCSRAIWDNYLTCVKCRLAAGICTLDAANPCLICESWLTITWSRLETGSIADSDTKDVDLDFAAVTAHSQVMELSVHQRPFEAPPSLDEGQAPTMDNLVPAPQCATLITCAHAQPLSPTSNQLLLAHSTSAAAPVLVTGPSFLPETQAPISMLPGAPWPSQPTPYAPRRASSQ